MSQFAAFNSLDITVPNLIGIEFMIVKTFLLISHCSDAPTNYSILHQTQNCQPLTTPMMPRAFVGHY